MQNKERGSTKNAVIRSNRGLKLVHKKIGPRALSSPGSEKKSLIVMFFIIGIAIIQTYY